MFIDRLLTGPKKSLRLFRPNAPPELNNALQSLSTNGYSVYSLIDDILVPCNAADIRARFFDQNPSGPEGAMKFGRAQCTCLKLFEFQCVTHNEY